MKKRTVLAAVLCMLISAPLMAKSRACLTAYSTCLNAANSELSRCDNLCWWTIWGDDEALQACYQNCDTAWEVATAICDDDYENCE